LDEQRDAGDIASDNLCLLVCAKCNTVHAFDWP